MGMMFMGSKFCPHCGSEIAVVTAGPETTRLCPRCSVRLEGVQVTNMPLEECTRCGGIWIDVTHFEYLCSNAEAQEAATGLRLPPPVAVDPHVRYLKCPQCSSLMNRMNYASRSGVIINVCRAHGIWLDRDGMREIIEFICAGGLDRARTLEKEELEAARREVEFDPVQPMVNMEDLSFRASINSDDRVHLLTGIASLANHFLGTR
jgi:Zn-finger nucleic acid-binding protein